MHRKLLSKLVDYSYTKGKLDEGKVIKIAGSLSRKDVKSYIRALKLSEKKKIVYIAIPNKSVYNTSRKLFEGIFGGKDIILQEDPSLLLGAKVIDNDMVFDFSLKERLESVADQIDEV